MKKMLISLLPFAAMCACGAGVDISTSLRRVNSPSGASPGRPDYAGSVTCGAPRNEAVFVTVEAYFVGRRQARGAKDELLGGAVVDRFEFGGDGPKTRAFDLPKTTELVAPTYGAGLVAPDVTNYCGVIVRTLVGGRVKSVKTIPASSAWMKAASSEVVSIGGAALRLELPPHVDVPLSERPRSDSEISSEVASAGGCVSAPFRFSIMWNYDARSKVDLDAHAVEPSGTEICFSSHKGSPTDIGGMLDVDMICPEEKGVENIFWPSLNKLADGEYRLFVRNFDGGRNHGSKAEVFYDGTTYLYEIGREIRGDVEIARLDIYRGYLVGIRHSSFLKK